MYSLRRKTKEEYSGNGFEINLDKIEYFVTPLELAVNFEVYEVSLIFNNGATEETGTAQNLHKTTAFILMEKIHFRQQ